MPGTNKTQTSQKNFVNNLNLFSNSFAEHQSKYSADHRFKNHWSNVCSVLFRFNERAHISDFVAKKEACVILALSTAKNASPNICSHHKIYSHCLNYRRINYADLLCFYGLYKDFILFF